ncbi:hypothetical protein [Novipirellula sp.]|uniref:hypothetical protein n=1 Tax=Novipirellula sp. TaxID=2795430 RepID=UPI0035661BFD
MSFSKNKQGHREIDASELVRYFGDECDFSRLEKPKGKSETNRIGGVGGEDLRAQLKAIEEERERERRQFQDQLDYLRKILDDNREEHKSSLRLLEDHSNKANGWKEAIAQMKKELTSQHEQEINQLKRALRSERDKGFWKRVFR